MNGSKLPFKGPQILHVVEFLRIFEMTMIINETTEENIVEYLCTTSKNEPEALIWANGMSLNWEHTTCGRPRP